MGTLAALLILCLQSDPKERLFDAIRETHLEEARKALADLAKGDGPRAAHAVLAALPRAKERNDALIRIALQARDNYVSTDTSLSFNIREEVARMRSLELAAAKIRETASRALEGERIYQSILDTLGSLKPGAVPVLAAEAERTALWPLKGEILEGLGAMGARTELAVVVEREPSPACLAVALEGSASDRAARFLSHPQWQVRLAALDSLQQSRGAVGTIVESMGCTDLRFRLKAADILSRLTRIDLPPEPGLWRDWWRANGEAFESGGNPPSRTPFPDGPGRTVAFFDIPVRSSRVCFVIDRSRSMREQDRFGAAKRELKRLLESMPDGSLVNIIFFSGAPSCFSKSPRLLDARTRREMIAFLDSSRLESATDLYAALEKALSMVGNPDTGRLLEDGVDTIVVLSDGQANTGRIIDDELLGTVIPRRARYLRPVFHTVSLGNDSRCLRLLAERTGGIYRSQ